MVICTPTTPRRSSLSLVPALSHLSAYAHIPLTVSHVASFRASLHIAAPHVPGRCTCEHSRRAGAGVHEEPHPPRFSALKVDAAAHGRVIDDGSAAVREELKNGAISKQTQRHLAIGGQREPRARPPAAILAGAVLRALAGFTAVDEDRSADRYEALTVLVDGEGQIRGTGLRYWKQLVWITHDSEAD